MGNSDASLDSKLDARIDIDNFIFWYIWYLQFYRLVLIIGIFLNLKTKESRTKISIVTLFLFEQSTEWRIK